MPRALTSATRLALALLLASTFPGLAAAQNQAAGARRVMALREATLKSGVSGATFERYFADSVARPFARHVPGLRAYLLNGERGARVAGYVIVYEFDSLNRRNEYFPKPDSISARFQQLARALPARALEDLEKYVTVGEYTDYIVLP